MELAAIFTMCQEPVELSASQELLAEYRQMVPLGINPIRKTLSNFSKDASQGRRSINAALQGRQDGGNILVVSLEFISQRGRP
jgi:hypothetical protein